MFLTVESVNGQHSEICVMCSTLSHTLSHNSVMINSLEEIDLLSMTKIAGIS